MPSLLLPPLLPTLTELWCPWSQQMLSRLELNILRLWLRLLKPNYYQIPVIGNKHFWACGCVVFFLDRDSLVLGTVQVL